MKNYISITSDEDLRFLCHRISAKALKDIYQNNGHAFTKLKRGFRPGSLTDEETFNFACTNKNEPFVADFINFTIDKWLDRGHLR